MTRSDLAEALEVHRALFVDLFSCHPLKVEEIQVETLNDNLPYRRVILREPQDLDRAIARLRAFDDPAELKDAVNGSLFVK